MISSSNQSGYLYSTNHHWNQPINQKKDPPSNQRNTRLLTPSESTSQSTSQLTDNNQQIREQRKENKVHPKNIRSARSVAINPNSNPPEENNNEFQKAISVLKDEYSKQKGKLSEALIDQLAKNKNVVSNDFSSKDGALSTLKNLETTVEKIKSNELPFDPKYYADLDSIRFEEYQHAFRPTTEITLPNLEKAEIEKIRQRSSTARENPKLTKKEKEQIKDLAKIQRSEVKAMISAAINELNCFVSDKYKKEIQQRYNAVQKEIYNIAQSYTWPIPKMMPETTPTPQCPAGTTESPLLITTTENTALLSPATQTISGMENPTDRSGTSTLEPEAERKTTDYPLQPSSTRKEQTTVQATTVPVDTTDDNGCAGITTPFQQPDQPEINLQDLTAKFARIYCRFSEEVSILNNHGLKKLKDLCQKSKQTKFDELANRYKTSLDKKAAKAAVELDNLINEFHSWNNYTLHNTRIHNIKLAEEIKESIATTRDQNKQAVNDIPEKHHCLTSDTEDCEKNPEIFQSPDTPEIDMQTLTSKFTRLHCEFSEVVSTLNSAGLEELKALCQENRQAEFDALAKNYEKNLNKTKNQLTTELDKLIDEFRSWDDYTLHNTRIHNLQLAREQKEETLDSFADNTRAISEITVKNSCLLNSTKIPVNTHAQTSTPTRNLPSTPLTMTTLQPLTTAVTSALPPTTIEIHKTSIEGSATSGTTARPSVDNTSPSPVTSTNEILVHELAAEAGTLLSLSLEQLSRLNNNKLLITTADNSKELLSSYYKFYENTLEKAVNEKKQSSSNSTFHDNLDTLKSDSVSKVSRELDSASHEVDLQFHIANLFDLFITTSSILQDIEGMNLPDDELLNELLSYLEIKPETEGISLFQKLIQTALDESRIKQETTGTAEASTPGLEDSDNNIGETTFNKVRQLSSEIYNLASKYRTALINSKRLPESLRPPATPQYLETQSERNLQNAWKTAATIIRRLPNTMDNILIEYNIVWQEEIGTCFSRLNHLFPQAHIRRKRDSDTAKTHGQDEYSGVRAASNSNIELKDDPNVISQNTEIITDLERAGKSLSQAMKYSANTSLRLSNIYFRVFKEKEEQLRSLLKEQSNSKSPLEYIDVIEIHKLWSAMQCYLNIAAQYYLTSSDELDKLVTERHDELNKEIDALQSNPFLQQHIDLKAQLIEPYELQKKEIHELWQSLQGQQGDQVEARIKRTRATLSKLESRYSSILNLSGESGKTDDKTSRESARGKGREKRSGTPENTGTTSTAHTGISEEYLPGTGDRLSAQSGIESSRHPIRQRRHEPVMPAAAQPYDSEPSGSSSLHSGVLPSLRKITESVLLRGANWLVSSMSSHFSKPSTTGNPSVNQPGQPVSALAEPPELLKFTGQTRYTGDIEDQHSSLPAEVSITLTDEQGESRLSSAMNQSPLDQIDNGSNPMTQKLVDISRNAWQQESQSLQNGDIHDLRLPFTSSEPFNAMVDRYANNHNGQLPREFAKTEKGFAYTSTMDFSGTCDPELPLCTVDSSTRGYKNGVGHIIRDAHREARAHQNKEQSSLYTELPVIGWLELANVAASLITKRKIIPSRTADALHNASNPVGKARHNSPGEILTRDSFAIAGKLYNELSVFLARINTKDPFISQQWSTDDILHMSIITCTRHLPDQPGLELIEGFVHRVLYSQDVGIEHNLVDNVFTLDDQGSVSIYGNAADSSVAFQRKNDMEPASNNARALLSCMLGAMAREQLKQDLVDNNQIIETALQLKGRRQPTVINTLVNYFNPGQNEPRQQRHALATRLAQLISNISADSNGQPLDCSIASAELIGTMLRDDIDSDTIAQVKDAFCAHAPAQQLTCIEDLLKLPDIYWVGGTGQLEQKVRSDLGNQQSGGNSEERWQMFLYLFDTRVKVMNRVNSYIESMHDVTRQRDDSNQEIINEALQQAQSRVEYLPQRITLYEQFIPKDQRLLPIPFSG